MPLLSILETLPPGRALDLACGAGRHSLWLAARGWEVTSVDVKPAVVDGVHTIEADLERNEFAIEPARWDLILCWLYWQPDLLPRIAAGLKENGVAALAGKTSGRFATSLANYRGAFPGWIELEAGEEESRAFFIARKPMT